MYQNEPSFKGPSFNSKIVNNVVRELGNHGTLLWRLFRSPAVPLWAKVVPVLSVIYWLSPFDFILIPFLGILPFDDLAVIVFGSKLFVELCPPDLVNQLRDELTYGPDGDDQGTIFDATYSVIDDD